MNGEETNRELYYEGFKYGVLLGQVKCIVGMIRCCLAMNWSIEEDEFLSQYPDFCREAVEIIKKYPNYSVEHLAKRVIFEATFLPY